MNILSLYILHFNRVYKYILIFFNYQFTLYFYILLYIVYIYIYISYFCNSNLAMSDFLLVSFAYICNIKKKLLNNKKFL